MTGLCILSVAFFRYVLICHPTRTALISRVPILAMHSIHGVLVLAIVANVLDLRFNFYPLVDKLTRDMLDTEFQLFLNNCEVRSVLSHRFIAEEIISLIDYFVCCKILQKKRSSRKRYCIEKAQISLLVFKKI